MFINKFFLFSSLIISLSIFTIASFGIIDPDTYGYRIFPGVAFVFATGALIQRSNERTVFIFLGSLWAYIFVLFLVHVVSGNIEIGMNSEVFTAYIIGVPLVFILRKIPRNYIDDTVGNLAYGVFLCHFMLIVIYVKAENWVSPMYYYTGLVVVSTLLSAVGYHIFEKTIHDHPTVMRLALRSKRNVQQK